MPKSMSVADKIAQEKERLKLKGQLLREREKKQQSKGFIDIGKLANQAGIDSMDPTTLLGAFIEIYERKKDEKSIDKWKKYAANCTKTSNKLNEVSVSVSLQTTPSLDIKKRLRNLGLRWNEFRKEFYGYVTSEEELNKVINDLNPKIEIFQ